MNKKANTNKNFLTMPDRVLRELTIIDHIFKAQTSKYNDDSFPYPILIDSFGNGGIDGRYFNQIIIYSEDELFNIQKFKDHVTSRYEKSIRSEILFDQLKKIKQLASDLILFFDNNFAPGSFLITEFYNKKKELKKNNEHFELSMFENEHNAIIFISQNLFFEYIYVCSSINNPLLESYDKQSYLFKLSDNKSLAFYCREILDFINPVSLNNAPSDSGINECTSDKVINILKPLLAIGSHGTAILSNLDFNKLVDTYVKFIDNNETPAKVDRIKFHGSNNEFFKPINNLHRQLGIKISGIGEVLTYHLLVNNAKSDIGEGMAPGTIEKNIKTNK